MARNRRFLCCPLGVAVWLSLALLPARVMAQGGEIKGRVTDEMGGTIVGARLVLHTTQGAAIQETRSSADGTFALGGAPHGSYWLEATADRFEVRRVPLDIGARPVPPIEILLGVGRFGSEITVTAERGSVADIQETAPIVTVRDGLGSQPLPTIGQALTGAAGVMVQQSTYGQASPFLRGLTGYHVLNLIDGVRFNNSTFRSGPNQYIALVDPSQMQIVEAMLGPSSSQFGSDSMGGTIQLLTPSAQFIDLAAARAAGSINLFAASADRSGGSDAAISVRASNAFLHAGGTWRELNDLRAGGGRDSHHVLTRLFGLEDREIQAITGSRQVGTGFSQSGVNAKLAIRVGKDQNLTAWYQGSELSGVRGYKDLWGGLGRLRSDFEPQRLRFSYVRYEMLDVKGLDSFTATLSGNSQTDGSARQGLKSSEAVTEDDVRVGVKGYAIQGTTHVTSRHDVTFGGEIYDEDVDALRVVTNPQTGAADERRALYPNGSEYRTSGVFVQDVVSIIPDRLRASVGARFSQARVRTFAERNIAGDGRDLGVADSAESFKDVTYNVGLTWRATDAVSVNVLNGRGFRAPNLNDLGALGLNDLGYEVPASAALAAGGFVGTSDGEGVVSSGHPIAALKAERLLNTEVGASLRWRKLYARAHVFHAELADPIVRRTVVFPLSSVPATVAGVPVFPIPASAAQLEQGVGSVATAADPRAVKAFVNDGEARYYGVDASFSYRMAARLSLEGNYSYLAGDDLHPTRPVRRLPPQQGFIAARYHTSGRLSWIEMSALISGAQSKLSGGDITDERIGAARRRSDITDFFQGSLISAYIRPGGDGRLGTADDMFAPTNETVAQIRDRVLPLGATINGVTVLNDGARVPLYLTTPAFVSLNLGAGVVIAPKIRLDLALMNALDRNYRVHGSGVDAPGISAFARFNVRF